MKSPPLRAAISFLASCVLALAASKEPKPPPKPPSQPTIEQGEIAGAKFAILVPVQWNHRLLLIAHGYRPDTAPLLADLTPAQPARRALLDEGWMIATTSFRRNGIILADAITDLDALREHIVKTYGNPERVLLEGESMGGLIVTLMAEREPDTVADTPRLYDGALAIGAALDLRENNMMVGLTLQPKIPLLFLTNQSEIEGPQHYVMPKTLPDNVGVHPVLFRISRNGHVNVSPRERVAALHTLNAWIEDGRETLPKPEEGKLFYDATLPLDAQSSRVTLHADGRGFDARVMEVNGVYGNVAINAQPDDFAANGIKPFMWLQLKVGDQTLRIRYGRDFASVKHGEWVVFPYADGYCWIARNFENAAATAGIKEGDTVALQLYDDGPAP